MSRILHAGSLVLACCTLIMTAGCGGADNRPERFPVAGSVTLNGSPVEGAVVTFIPKTRGGTSATGRTDAQGNYKLTTFTSGDGALPGNYRVKISKYDTAAETAAAATVAAGDDGGEINDEGYEAPEENEEEPAEKNLLPENYADAVESGLEATVTEGENNFDFALEG